MRSELLLFLFSIRLLLFVSIVTDYSSLSMGYLPMSFVHVLIVVFFYLWYLNTRSWLCLLGTPSLRLDMSCLFLIICYFEIKFMSTKYFLPHRLAAGYVPGCGMLYLMLTAALCARLLLSMEDNVAVT